MTDAEVPAPPSAPAPTRHHRGRWLAAVLAIAVVGGGLFAYNRGLLSSQAEPADITVTSTVTGDDQVIDVGSGVAVRISAGALPAGSTVTAHAIADSSADLPPGAVSPVTLELSASSGQPTGPITVELPFDPERVTSTPLVLHQHGDEIWLPEPTTVDQDVASAQVESFSKFSVGDAWRSFTSMVADVTNSAVDAGQRLIGNDTVHIDGCTEQLAPWLSDAVFLDDWKTALHTCSAGGDSKRAYVMIGNNRNLPTYVSIDKPYTISNVWPGQFETLPEALMTAFVAGNVDGKKRAGDRFFLPAGAVARVEIPRPKRIPEDLKITISPDAYSDGIPTVTALWNLVDTFADFAPERLKDAADVFSPKALTTAALVYNCIGDTGRVDFASEAAAGAVRSCAVKASETALEQIASGKGDTFDRFVAEVPDPAQREVALQRAGLATKLLKLWSVSTQFLDAVRLWADQTTNTPSTLFISPELLSGGASNAAGDVDEPADSEPEDSAPSASETPQQQAAGSGGFEVGASGTYRCIVAWPFAPARSQSAVSFRSTCVGQPRSILFVDITVPDPNYTPPGGRQFTLSGQIVDHVRSDLGFQTLSLLADGNPE